MYLLDTWLFLCYLDRDTVRELVVDLIDWVE